MKDCFERKINYLRLSVTDRCNLNCIYCSPLCEKHNTDYSECMQPEDFEKIVDVMADLGIEKVRLTGGEPLVRRDLCDIIERISRFETISDISLTTNGVRLAEMAADLKKAGLRRVNVSLDSLQEERMKKVTGQACLQKVLNGIHKALEVGIRPVRINVVLIRRINDDEIGDLIDLAKNLPVDIRFIELMPMSRFGETNKDKIVYNTEILKLFPELTACKTEEENGPAKYYTMQGLVGRIGLISPMSHQFCDSCNRIRVTADGKLRPCLGKNGEIDMMPALRHSRELLLRTVENAIYNKPEGHSFREGFVSQRKMIGLGG